MMELAELVELRLIGAPSFPWVYVGFQTGGAPTPGRSPEYPSASHRVWVCDV